MPGKLLFLRPKSKLLLEKCTFWLQPKLLHSSVEKSTRTLPLPSVPLQRGALRKGLFNHMSIAIKQCETRKLWADGPPFRNLAVLPIPSDPQITCFSLTFTQKQSRACHALSCKHLILIEVWKQSLINVHRKMWSWLHCLICWGIIYF